MFNIQKKTTSVPHPQPFFIIHPVIIIMSIGLLIKSLSVLVEHEEGQSLVTLLTNISAVVVYKKQIPHVSLYYSLTLLSLCLSYQGNAGDPGPVGYQGMKVCLILSRTNIYIRDDLCALAVGIIIIIRIVFFFFQGDQGVRGEKVKRDRRFISVHSVFVL